MRHILILSLLILGFTASAQTDSYGNIKVEGLTITYTPHFSATFPLVVQADRAHQPRGKDYILYSFENAALLKQYIPDGRFEFEQFKQAFFGAGLAQCQDLPDVCEKKWQNPKQ